MPTRLRPAILLLLAFALPLAACPKRTTTIVGTARNAKGGAVVLADDGEPVYVEGLDAWSGEVDGRRVRVTGLLRRKKLLPEPVLPPAPAVAGAEGEQVVLEKATWVVE